MLPGESPWLSNSVGLEARKVPPTSSSVRCMFACGSGPRGNRGGPGGDEGNVRGRAQRIAAAMTTLSALQWSAEADGSASMISWPPFIAMARAARRPL